MKNESIFPIASLIAFCISWPVIHTDAEKNKEPSFTKPSAAPSVGVTDLNPVSGDGSVVYLTCAPATAKGSLSSLLSVKFTVKNQEAKTIYLNKIVYECTGNGKNISKTFFPDDDKKDTILSGKSYSWQNSRTYHELGNVIQINAPFPNQLAIKLYFDGYTEPFIIQKSLKGFLNEVPVNAYAYP